MIRPDARIRLPVTMTRTDSMRDASCDRQVSTDGQRGPADAASTLAPLAWAAAELPGAGLLTPLP
ncbi:hypothetical protein GCM10027089_22580 [Nocardia thraciensis]